VLAAAAADLLANGAAASLAQDGLYGGIAVLLGVNAWNERAALQQRLGKEGGEGQTGSKQ
jgi:hypothetical protein